MSESNNNIPMRITQLEEATSYPEDSYIPMAKAGYGTKKINTKVLTPKEKFVTDGIQLNDQVKGMIFSNFCDKVQTLDLPQIVLLL